VETVTGREESYNANLESPRHGLATITDLIGAERDLTTARYTFVQIKAGPPGLVVRFGPRGGRGLSLECAPQLTPMRCLLVPCAGDPVSLPAPVLAIGGTEL
jgi:hypothetical protein